MRGSPPFVTLPPGQCQETTVAELLIEQPQAQAGVADTTRALRWPLAQSVRDAVPLELRGAKVLAGVELGADVGPVGAGHEEHHVLAVDELAAGLGLVVAG